MNNIFTVDDNNSINKLQVKISIFYIRMEIKQVETDNFCFQVSVWKS